MGQASQNQRGGCQMPVAFGHRRGRARKQALQGCPWANLNATEDVAGQGTRQHIGNYWPGEDGTRGQFAPHKEAPARFGKAD